MKRLVLLLALSGLMWGSVAAQRLPVSRVLLYKNGMAYLVRSGTIQEPLSLSFHPQDMKDVLKTFSAWNPASGRLYSVGYTTGIPTSQILSRFPFSLSNSEGGLAHFLSQVQGADLQLELGSRAVSGKLITINREQNAVDQQTLVTDHLLSIFQPGGTVQRVWLSDVNSLRLVDPELNDQLEAYLAILAEGNQDVTREITVYPVPEPGSVQVAYVQQFPVWKTSYRLDLSASEASVQGWAQIDNPTGEAWNNVDLTLISGMPVSFIMDLYQPLYTSRSTVAVPGAEVAAPRSYEAAVRTRRPPMAQVQSMAPQDQPRESSAKVAAEAAIGGGMGLSNQLVPARGGAGFTEAVASQVQDYFEYRFPSPVQLSSRQSALLPFLKKTISLEQVSVFNPASDKNHPLSGVWLENDTGVPLEAGPLTFFVEGRYAGEAVLEHLSRNDRRLVSYGVDYDVEVSSQRKSDPETTVQLIIRRGTLFFKRESIQTTGYDFRNKAEREKTILLEHPRRPGREIKDLEPVETTQNFYRFQLNLRPDEERSFPVQEIVSRQVTLSAGELDRRQLEVHFTGLRIPSGLRQQLESIVATRERIAALQADVKRLDQDVESIFGDQTRLRENLRSLGRSEDERQLRQRYINQMDGQENQLVELRGRRSGLNLQISELENQLSSAIAQLSVSLEFTRSEG